MPSHTSVNRLESKRPRQKIKHGYPDWPMAESINCGVAFADADLICVLNGYSGFGYDPSVEIRNGITQSMAQSSSRILDRFLNRMPTVTIREGTRVKVILTDDLQLPTYDSMRKGDL